jgi:hypothetical protein
MAILFNGAALLVAGASIVVVARSFFVSEHVPPCSERYQIATRLMLDREGTPMGAEDLQSRLGNSDWGLLEGTRVVKLKSGPAKHALELNLGTARTANATSPEERAGIGFTWTPQSFGNPRAACLSYSVYLPDGFVFGKGGRLPGLRGSSNPGSAGDEPSFAARFGWEANGKLDVLMYTADFAQGRTVGSKRQDFRLETGRWLLLEQEIVLNSLGAANGELRVWQDGRMVMEKKSLVFRSQPAVELAGVLAEVVAGDVPAETSRGPQKIWLTPFELRWQ